MARPMRKLDHLAPTNAAPKVTQDELVASELVYLARWEPVEFARQVLNHRQLPGERPFTEDASNSWELEEFQRDLLEAVADVWRKKKGVPTRVNHRGCNFITVRSGHGPGKTHTAALIAQVFMAAFRSRIVCTAPKFDQLKTRLWGALRRIDARAEAWFRRLHEINDTTVYARVPNDDGRIVSDKEWCILAETATAPENLAGHHDLYQLVIVEESSGVPESLFPVILSALSSGVVQIMLLIGNPTKEQGFFADSHRKKNTEAQYFRYHVTLEKSRRVNRDWYQKLVEKYGVDSPVVRVRGRGEFPGSSPKQLIALEWLEAARVRGTDPVRGDGSLPWLVVSLDCAAGGENETVATAARHFASCWVGLKQKRHSFKLATAALEAAEAAEALFKAHGGTKDSRDYFVVDSLGVGVGAAGFLIAWGYRVVLYQGGAASDDTNRWRCRRVQSYINLRNDLRDGCMAFVESFFEDVADWDDLDGQLTSIQHPPDDDKLEDLVTKKRMVEMGLPSPDMADSLAMQKATQAPEVVPAGSRTEELPALAVVVSNVNRGLE